MAADEDFVHPLHDDQVASKGHVTRCSAQGLRHRCPGCGKVQLTGWAALDAHQEGREQSTSVRVPPCSCGVQLWLMVNDEEYAEDDPSFETQRAVHEHVLPKLKHHPIKVMKVRTPIEHHEQRPGPIPDELRAQMGPQRFRSGKPRDTLGP